MKEEFCEKNLMTKEQFMQNEHKIILKVIYEDAQNNGRIVKSGFNCGIAQIISLDEISGKVSSIDREIVGICLNDLEYMGFIMRSYNVPGEQIGYEITYLGVKYQRNYTNRKNN